MHKKKKPQCYFREEKVPKETLLKQELKSDQLTGQTGKEEEEENVRQEMAHMEKWNMSQRDNQRMKNITLSVKQE